MINQVAQVCVCPWLLGRIKFIFHVSLFIHTLCGFCHFASIFISLQPGWLAGLDSALSAGMGCSLASERVEEGNCITARRSASQIQTEISYSWIMWDPTNYYPNRLNKWEPHGKKNCFVAILAAMGTSQKVKLILREVWCHLVVKR